jgi:hypothetical protein
MRPIWGLNSIDADHKSMPSIPPLYASGDFVEGKSSAILVAFL